MYNARYLIFGFKKGKALGGWNDLLTSKATLKCVDKFVKDMTTNDYSVLQVYDTAKGELVNIIKFI